MRSRRHLRNSTRFPSLGRRRSWENFLKPDSHSRSDSVAVPAGPPLPIAPVLPGVGRSLTLFRPTDFPEVRFWNTSGLQATRELSPATREKSLMQRLPPIPSLGRCCRVVDQMQALQIAEAIQCSVLKFPTEAQANAN